MFLHVGFRLPFGCSYAWAPTWRLHSNLYKFGGKASPHILRKKLLWPESWRKSLLVTSFLFSHSGLNLLSSFDFYLGSILNGVTLKTSNSCFSVWYEIYRGLSSFIAFSWSKSFKYSQNCQIHWHTAVRVSVTANVSSIGIKFQFEEGINNRVIFRFVYLQLTSIAIFLVSPSLTNKRTKIQII